jgi:hypothetical protein
MHIPPRHSPSEVTRSVGVDRWSTDPSAAAAVVTVEDLAEMSLGQLEQVWSLYPCAPLPGGVWQGRYLSELPMAPTNRLLARALFKWRVFGVDLNTNKWWFRDATRSVATFEPQHGPSRWRDADVIQLHYQRTGPRLFRHMLYDELKPLNEHCILGLGGSNHDNAHGTWFFFALSPVPVL